MGVRGPLKLPAHLRPVTDPRTAGSAAEVVPKDAPLKPPAVINNEALSGLWDEIVPQLAEVGLVARSDGPAIELALRHFLLARRASDEVGTLVSVRATVEQGGAKKAPAEAVFRLESAAFLEYAKQLGMTFVARARTPAAKGREDGNANPFAASSF